MGSGDQLLRALFDADRQARVATQRLLDEESPSLLISLLQEATLDARRLEDRDEGITRLHRLAELCAQVPGPEMVDTLIEILDDEDAGVRVAAGEALLSVAYERYAEVARGVERCLDQHREGVAMRELPFLIAEVGEPSALPLIVRFLGREDEETIASGIEALTQLEDPAALKHLRPLENDPRTVMLHDAKNSATTVGALAKEAISYLEQLQ